MLSLVHPCGPPSRRPEGHVSCRDLRLERAAAGTQEEIDGRREWRPKLANQEGSHVEEERREEEKTEFYMPYEKVPGEPRPRSDQDITRDIASALFYDEAVRSYRVRIDVANGLVTLSGSVDSDAEKRKAEEDATVVPGVRGVSNNLTVQPAT